MTRVKRDALELRKRAINSLVLAIEIFNRPFDLGRTETVIILLHHSFEMLLKSVIFQKTGTVHDKEHKYSYSFDQCLDICYSRIKIIDSNQKATLSILDSHRDTTTHYYQDISEDMLYIQAQTSVTLFDKILWNVYGIRLAGFLPDRILPISTKPPKDLQLLIDTELKRVDELLAIGDRKGPLAMARLRPILALATATRETDGRINEAELRKAVTRRRRGEEWGIIFPEVGELNLNSDGNGIGLSFRIDKRSELAVRIAQPGEQVIGTVIKQEINPWDVFNLNLTDLSQKLGLTQPKTLALIEDLKLKEESTCYRVLVKKSLRFQGYSKKALDICRAHLENNAIDTIWQKHKYKFTKPHHYVGA